MKTFRLNQLNPLVFIIILIVVSIIISFDRMPFLDICLLVVIIVLQVLFSSYSLIDLLRQIRIAFFVGFIYVFFIWLTRALTNLPIDYYYLGALLGRFLIFSSYTFALVNHVSTKRLTMALIKYFKLSDRVGYSFMAVYKFLPTFRKELSQIQYTYATRGINHTGVFAGLKNMFSYSIPLLVTSIRKGMRLSVSMENRGLGKFKSRSYYQCLEFDKQDALFLISYFIIFIIIVMAGLYFGWIKF